MHTQEMKFAVQKENGIVTKIGKSTICQPEMGPKGSMKRHQRMSAMDTRNKNQKG